MFNTKGRPLNKKNTEKVDQTKQVCPDQGKKNTRSSNTEIASGKKDRACRKSDRACRKSDRACRKKDRACRKKRSRVPQKRSRVGQKCPKKIFLVAEKDSQWHKNIASNKKSTEMDDTGRPLNKKNTEKVDQTKQVCPDQGKKNTRSSNTEIASGKKDRACRKSDRACRKSDRACRKKDRACRKKRSRVPQKRSRVGQKCPKKIFLVAEKDSQWHKNIASNKKSTEMDDTGRCGRDCWQ
ncbi:uncharacterized protein LOC126413314 [Schistocerca serialis cubense]|uniref:uncharacterized protein LOC126413314 n=1 Tax=Schistocerca serialis cubense TaxID=2023355 RepID=UPI00214EB1BA|nr:uncharacterized protein LOC126413314 [Schistocerca serialis cubense]